VLEDILSVWVLLAVGVMFGVLGFLWIALLPMFRSLSGPGFTTACQGIEMETAHPILFWNAIVAIALAVVLAIVTDSWPARILLAAGAVGTALVGIISEGRNRPMWRQIEKWNPDALPTDWSEIRTRWNFYHSLRTIAAGIAFAAFAVAAVIIV